MDTKRITIFVGNYGSGKTEISINYSLYLLKIYESIMLIDLDVINPYFRSREKSTYLQSRGIEVIFPENLVYADLPIIPPEVQRIIQNKDSAVVFDIGGDEEGATALSSIVNRLSGQEYEVVLVVNTFRDRTRDVEEIIQTKERIEERSRLEITKIVCNVNLGHETNYQLINDGYLIVKEAADKMSLPIKFIAMKKSLFPLSGQLGMGEEIFPIDIYMKLPWVR